MLIKNLFTKGFLIIFSILLTSCMTVNGSFGVKLDQVELLDQASTDKEVKMINLDETDQNNLSFEDDNLLIDWTLTRTGFGFNLQNKTQSSMKIIWDESLYIDHNGYSSRVLHYGVKYIDRNNSQPATVVIRNGKLEDVVIPTDNIYYVSGQYGGWRTSDLFPLNGYAESEVIASSKKYIGDIVKVYLPIEVDGSIKEYTFNFNIVDYTVLN